MLQVLLEVMYVETKSVVVASAARIDASLCIYNLCMDFGLLLLILLILILFFRFVHLCYCFNSTKN
ncbi:hypothetical protein HanXRQr2_Chr08g0352771 [Helianthus annuus]|uniref:Uncharacterized protein n=1 Tax=Helianthus annuus TaxID=4232 RepID=A0A9K3IHD8_HELAN|nr:hypothetical protein HanXRQr2_Chr08g0352771 [Helianthus annuus]